MTVTTKKETNWDKFRKKHDKCNISFVDLNKTFRNADLCPICNGWL